MRLLVLLGLSAISALACDTRELRRQDHMAISVSIDTANEHLRKQFIRALDYWSSVLDMHWREVSASGTCNIRLMDAAPGELHSTLDDAEIIAAAFHDGTIKFDPQYRFKRVELYSVSVHELGHEFGLNHNPDSHSFMRAEGSRRSDRLTLLDLSALKAIHALR